jgi:hypothetical protein
LAFGSIAVAGSKPQAIGNLLPANYTRSFLMLDFANACMAVSPSLSSSRPAAPIRPRSSATWAA